MTTTVDLTTLLIESAAKLRAFAYCLRLDVEEDGDDPDDGRLALAKALDEIGRQLFDAA